MLFDTLPRSEYLSRLLPPAAAETQRQRRIERSIHGLESEFHQAIVGSRGTHPSMLLKELRILRAPVDRAESFAQ